MYSQVLKIRKKTTMILIVIYALMLSNAEGHPWFNRGIVMPQADARWYTPTHPISPTNKHQGEMHHELG